MVKITVEVNGMMCGNCEKHVNKAIENAFKVKKVTSDHKANRTEIIADEPIDEGKLKAVIEDDGYQAGVISVEPYEKKGIFG